jgi:hypothetical protein
LNSLNLRDKIDLKTLKEAIMKRDPILVLIDIGGSLLCRAKYSL